MNVSPSTSRFLARLAMPVAALLLAIPAARAATPLNAIFNSATDVPVTASSYTATGSTVNFTLNFAPLTGTTLTVVENTGLDLIQGTFYNLAQGQAVDLGYGGTTYHFVASYYGGTGNDLVLLWADTMPVAWGSNVCGQLGNNSNLEHPAPVAVDMSGVLAGKTVIAVAAGSGFSLALCADGTLAAWGRNDHGELGSHSTAQMSLVPVLVDQTGVLAGKTVIAMAAGASHNLVLCSDGTLAAWGYNGEGELGTNSLTNSSVPVRVNISGVLHGKTLVAVAAGSSFSLVLCSDGTLAAWGANFYGELGINSKNNTSLVPVAVDTSGVLGGRSVIAMAAGQTHALALCSDGTLAAWGDNDMGQLGNPYQGRSRAPVTVDTSGVLSGRTVTAIAAGLDYSVALCSDGTLANWGYNRDGELGNGTTTNSPVPVRVDQTGVLAGRNIMAVAAGYEHNMVLCADGTPAAWGSNIEGALGDNSEVSSPVLLPVAVSTATLATGSRFVAVASSRDSQHNVGLVALPQAPQMEVNQPAAIPLISGSTVDFGSAVIGTPVSKTFTIENLGTTPLALSTVSLNAADGSGFTLTGTPAATVAAGSNTTLTVTFNAITTTTGSATLEILSNDPTSADFTANLVGTGTGALAAMFNAATDVPVTATGYTATANTANFTLNFAPAPGITLTVINNTGLDFIHGTFSNLTQGQRVDLSYGGVTYNFVANYFGGSGNDLVLQWADTRLVGWGSNNSGQLSYAGPAGFFQPEPLNASGALAGKTIIALAAGNSHSLALCSDGTLAAWGNNDGGQLGNHSTKSSLIPVKVVSTGVLAGRTVIAIAVGGAHNLALCSDGTLVAWGRNGDGQLGNNSLNSSSVPVAVDASGVLRGRTVIALAAGDSHSMALCLDGTLATWGYNGEGELGNSYIADALAPGAVDTFGVLQGKTVIAIAAGESHSLALCADGTLAGWGYNNTGSLTDRFGRDFLPVAIDTSGVLHGKTIVALAAGLLHSLALCSDGSIAAWGQAAMLGNGAHAASADPALVDRTGVLAGKTVISVAASQFHSLALCSDGTLAAWGYDSEGQLGNQSITQGNVPVAVSTAALAVGSRFAMAASGCTSRSNLALIASPPTASGIIAGSYAGLVQPVAGGDAHIGTEGLFTATVQASGAFTSRLAFDGQVFSIAGFFDAQGTARFGTGRTPTLTLKRGAKPSLVVDCHRDGFSHIMGTLTAVTFVTTPAGIIAYATAAAAVSTIGADLAAYNGKTPDTTVPAAYLGKADADGVFTVILPAQIPATPPAGFPIANFPKGTGFGTVKISKAGLASFSGRLADGTPVTASAPLGHPDGNILSFPLFAQLYNKAGFISASVILDSTNKDTDLSVGSGSVLWSQPFMNALYYPPGWPRVFTAGMSGAKYVVTPGQSILPGLPAASAGGNALLDLEQGLLTTPFTRSVDISPADVVTKLPATDKTFTLVLNRTTGQFSGMIIQPSGNKPAFQGIIYQKGTNAGGHGYFLNPSAYQSGVVSLTAKAQ